MVGMGPRCPPPALTEACEAVLSSVKEEAPSVVGTTQEEGGLGKEPGGVESKGRGPPRPDIPDPRAYVFLLGAGPCPDGALPGRPSRPHKLAPEALFTESPGFASAEVRELPFLFGGSAPPC